VEFSTEGCPTEPGELAATIHTHPPGSSGRLSPTDRRTFRAGSWSYMCVQVGPISETVGDRTTQLRCYEKSWAHGTTMIAEVPVQVVD
jgi:proteasome lid subunit RPN8/RPN11